MDDFSSEFVEGGDINTNTKLFGGIPVSYIIIVLVILLLLYIIFKIGRNIPIMGETYNQRKVRSCFNEISGEAFDDAAKNAIKYGSEIKNPRAIDHYRIGVVQLFNAKQPAEAHQHFRQALEQIIEGNVDVNDGGFILDRIDDFKDQFIDFVDIDELPLQRALYTHLNQIHNEVEKYNNVRKETKINESDPEFTQKTILARQHWVSDSQNVHDNSIFGELKGQIAQARNENIVIPNIELHTYRELCDWLKMKYEDNPSKLEKVHKVLRFTNENYPIGALNNINEQDLLQTLWQRSYHPENRNNANIIRESIADNIIDCVEGSNVVCITGRASKLWSSLAHRDFNPDMGILQTRQSLRNEIYERCSKIVDDYIGKNGSASEDLKAAYNRGENTEQVDEIIACIRSDMDNIKPDYKDKMSLQQLNSIIEECKNIV